VGTVTPIVVPGEGYTRIEVNWQDFPHARVAWVYRTVAGVRTTLREGKSIKLSNGVAVLFDHEMPYDVPVVYSSTIALNYNGSFEEGVSEWTSTANSGTVGTVTQSKDYYVAGEGVASAKLTPDGSATVKAASEIIPITPSARNANPFFETDASNWSGANGAAVSRDTANFHQGVASLLIVPNGVSSTPQAQSEEVSVVAGQSYTYSAWLRISSGGSASRDVGIAWFNASHVFISSSVTTLSPAATVWTKYGPVTATAPAGAAFARLITTGPGVLAAANTWRIDEAIIWDATAAATYTIVGRLMVPDYWSGGIGVELQWYDGTTLLGTTGAFNDLVPFPGNWGSYGFSATDMASANGVRAVFGMTGSPPTTLPLYGDEVYVYSSGTTVTASSVTVPGDGAGWWVDPLHPATKLKLIMNLQVTDCVPESAVGLVSLSEETFPADGEALEINNAVFPLGAWQVRKSGRQTIQVVTITLADLAQLKALYASGAPLYLQLPAEYAEAAAYQLHGDLEVTRLAPNHKLPWRVARSSFAKVAAPVGPPEGTWNTRYVDIDKYATFSAASAASVTWVDALQGELAV